MSTEALNADRSTFAAFMEMVERVLPESAESMLIYLHSSPLVQLSMATGKNTPYLIAAKEFRVYDLCHAVSSRGNYFEVACLSVATLVHHTSLAIFYSMFVVFTLGQFESVNYCCRKHWAHILHSGIGMAVGGVGVFSPTLAGNLNLGVLKMLYQSLRTGYQNDLKQFEPALLGRIRGFFNEYKDRIIKMVIERHPELFHSEYDPFFRDLSRKVNTAQNVTDLQEAALFVWEKMSRGRFEQKEDLGNQSESLQMSKGDWSEIYRFLRALKEEAWNKMPETTDAFYQILSSTSLVQLTSATLKNLSYVAKAREFGVYDSAHFLSSRVNYLESALMSMASMVYNVAMAALYTCLTMLTMGQVREVYYSCKIHWIHLSHSVACMGISLLGTILPTLGALFNLLLITDQVPNSSFFDFERSFLHRFRGTYRQDHMLYKDQMLEGVKAIYLRYHPVLRKFIKEWFEIFLKSEHKPFMKYIDQKISEADKMEKLGQLVVEIWRKFPRVHLSNDAKIGSTKPTAMFRYYE